MVEKDLTTEEVAATLRLHRATVQRLLKSGRLRGYQIGRSWRVPQAALEEFRHGAPGSPEQWRSGGVAGEERAALESEDEWERMLLSEEDLASAPPIPAAALRREQMYAEGP